MDYEEALAWTEAKGLADAGSSAAREGLERLENFFRRVSPESVWENARLVYAPDCFFNDTIKTLASAGAIESYFLKTLRFLDSFRVEFLDASPSGRDTYVRWRMDIKTKPLPLAKTLRSFGMSQFRFDTRGRVLLHQDFWDSGGNLYAHIPLLGSAISLVKRLA